MKATEQYSHVVLFIVLYKTILTFKSVDETLGYVCEHSSENYQAILSCKYPEPFHRGFFEFNPTPTISLEIPLNFSLKNLAFDNPLPLTARIFDYSPSGWYGYF